MSANVQSNLDAMTAAQTAAEAALGPLAQAWQAYLDAYRAAMQAEYAAGGEKAQFTFDHMHGQARAAKRLVLKMRRAGLGGLLSHALDR